jgi:hypothetical protein
MGDKRLMQPNNSNSNKLNCQRKLAKSKTKGKRETKRDRQIMQPYGQATGDRLII